MRFGIWKPLKKYNKNKRNIIIKDFGINKLVRFSVYKKLYFFYRINNLELLFKLRGKIGCIKGLI